MRPTIRTHAQAIAARARSTRVPSATPAAAATSTGIVSSCATSRHTSSTGTSALAALAGAAYASAASDAPSAPPAPTTSGPNQRTGMSASQAAVAGSDSRSVRHSQSPYRPANGQASGRMSPAATARARAAWWRPSRCATTAHTAAAASSPSELPRKEWKSHQSLTSIRAGATAAATGPARRSPSAETPPSASRPPARATTSHRAGAIPPASAKADVKTTESGFHDGPPAVSRSRRVTSRPQMIQDHASKAIAQGASRLSAATASAAATTRAGRRTRSRKAGDEQQEGEQQHQHDDRGEPAQRPHLRCAPPGRDGGARAGARRRGAAGRAQGGRPVVFGGRPVPVRGDHAREPPAQLLQRRRRAVLGGRLAGGVRCGRHGAADRGSVGRHLRGVGHDGSGVGDERRRVRRRRGSGRRRCGRLVGGRLGDAPQRHRPGGPLRHGGADRRELGGVAAPGLLRLLRRGGEGLAQLVDLGLPARALGVVLRPQPRELRAQLLALGRVGLVAPQLDGRLVGHRRCGELLARGHQLALAARQLRPEAVDLRAQRPGLEPQLLRDRLLRREAPPAAPPPVGQRQLHHDVAPQLELRADDLGGIAGPVEGGVPALLGRAELPARHRDDALAATRVQLHGEHRPGEPAPGQPLPAADDVQAVLGPLEGLQLEGDLAHRRHHTLFSPGGSFPSAGGIGSVAPVSEATAAGASGAGSGSGTGPLRANRRPPRPASPAGSASGAGTGSCASVTGSAGRRASTASTRRRGSRGSIVSAIPTRPNVSSPPAIITRAPTRARIPPSSGSCPDAAGGGSRIWETAISVTAPAAHGSQRRSTTSRSGTASPMPATMHPTDRTSSTTSQTSKACQALMAGSYQSRKRLASRSSAPNVTRPGPASSLRVIRPPALGSLVRADTISARTPARRPQGAAGPRSTYFFVTLISICAVLVAPPLSVTVTLAMNVPGFVYRWLTLAPVAGLVPSPKSYL